MCSFCFGIIEKPLTNNVHIFHFTIFKPMEQNLLNLELFLLLEINYNLKLVFSMNL